MEGKLIVDIAEDDSPATELHMWEAKLDLSNMSAARNVAPISDNYFLDDEELAIQEVSEVQEIWRQHEMRDDQHRYQERPGGTPPRL